MLSVYVKYSDISNQGNDFDGYVGNHIPFVREKLVGEGLLEIHVEASDSYPENGSLIQAVMIFDSAESFETCMQSHGNVLAADASKYVTAEPEILVAKRLS